MQNPDRAALERRVAELESELSQRNAELARRDAELAERDAALAALKREHERLQHEHDKLARRLFGQTAERVDPAQLALAFVPPPEPESPPPPPYLAEAPDGETAAPESAKGTKKKGHGRRPLPDSLERKRVEIHPPEDQRVCACGAHKVVIGEERHEILERVPATFYVVEQARMKYACPKGCEAALVCPPPPAAPVEKGLAGPGLLAWVAVSKFTDHLPLHRIARIMEREGIDVAISTLVGWTDATAGLLEPVVDQLRANLLQSPVVQLDETGIKVVEKGAPGGVRKARMWAYRGDVGNVVFVHSATKGNSDPDGPAKVLEDYSGIVQADAYGGFDQLFKSGRIVEAACWAHTRRKFFEAKDSSPKEAAWALLAIRKLYEIESEAKERNLDPAARLVRRREASKPVVDDFFSWISRLRPEPKSLLATAVTYALNQQEALRRFLDDGRLEADNNACERALRAVACGRKNWLFAGNEAAARRAAIFYSLVVSCRELEIDPAEYLRDVLERVSTHPSTAVDELTPRRWLAARRQSQPTRS